MEPSITRGSRISGVRLDSCGRCGGRTYWSKNKIVRCVTCEEQIIDCNCQWRGPAKGELSNGEN
jgi:uncharacterized membrane protein